jgi:hypothetical protein
MIYNKKFGLGVYTTVLIPFGTTVEQTYSPFLTAGAAYGPYENELNNYIENFNATYDRIPLGFGSIYNHAPSSLYDMTKKGRIFHTDNISLAGFKYDKPDDVSDSEMVAYLSSIGIYEQPITTYNAVWTIFPGTLT